MVRFSSKVFGVNKTIAGLSKKKGSVDDGVQKAMILISLNEEANIKKSVGGHSAEPKSVDTGVFMNSIKGRAHKDYARVYSTVPYSWYLEMGTSRIGARHHFQNTLARDKNAIENILKQVIKVDLII